MFFGRANLLAVGERFHMLRTATQPTQFRAKEASRVLALSDAMLVVGEPICLLVHVDDAHAVYTALSALPHTRLSRKNGSAPADFARGSFGAKPCVVTAAELASTGVQFYVLG